MNRAAFPFLALLTLASPLQARDSLGVYSDWASFRDDAPSRCYAIAKPTRSAETGPYATIASWPGKGLRGQLHIRLSRAVEGEGTARLTIGNQSFELVAKDHNAWAKDARDDAAIIAAMRSAPRMSVSARSGNGSRFSDRYSLAGVATAMDAATVGCANRG